MEVVQELQQPLLHLADVGDISEKGVFPTRPVTGGWQGLS